MPAPLLIPAAMVAASALSSYMGSKASEEASEAQMAAMREGQQYFIGLGYPPDVAAEIAKIKVMRTGELSPELEQEIQSKEAEQITEDPELIDRQMSQLSALQQMSQTGLGPEDLLALDQINRQQAAKTIGARDAILQAARASGTAGSGAELMIQQNAAQNAANEAHSSGLQQAANAAQARRAALEQYSGLTSSVRGQNYNTLAANTGAKNQFIAQANERNSSRQARNVASQNQSALQNRQFEQNALNQELDLKKSRADAIGSRYTQAMQRAQGMAGQSSNIGNAYGDQAQRTQNLYTGVGQAVSGGLGMYGASQSNNNAYDQDTGKPLYKFDPKTGKPL